MGMGRLQAGPHSLRPEPAGGRGRRWFQLRSPTPRPPSLPSPSHPSWVLGAFTGRPRAHWGIHLEARGQTRDPVWAARRSPSPEEPLGGGSPRPIPPPQEPICPPSPHTCTRSAPHSSLRPGPAFRCPEGCTPPPWRTRAPAGLKFSEGGCLVLRLIHRGAAAGRVGWLGAHGGVLAPPGPEGRIL